MAVTWGAFRTARPDLEAKGREFLYEYGVGLAFLATVRQDGGPRVHPICPVLVDDRLYGLIVPGPKLNDLRRDPRYALHTETYPPPRQDDGFYMTGTAVEVRDAATQDRIATQFLAERGQKERWPGFDDQVMFEFLLDRCLLSITTPGDAFPGPQHTPWRAADSSGVEDVAGTPDDR